MANGIVPQDIQQAALGPAPAPAPAPVEAPPGDQAGALPDDLIQQPVMQALMAGTPPATSTPLKTAAESPLGQIIAKNVEPLKKAGFGFYRSQDGALGVMFNQLKINPQEIIQADQQGNLLQVAPPVEQVEQAVLSDPAANPALTAQPPGGAAQPPIPGGGGGAPPAAAAGGVPGPSGSIEQQLFTARKQGTQLGSPTSGPKPGAGRVANTLLRNVV
jgi:hypothetical protein